MRRTKFLADCGEFHSPLFQVIEEPDGESYLIIAHAENFGIDDPPLSQIIEQRYSIHTTSRSKEYTMMKQTLQWGESEKVTKVNLNDAIKSRSGFAPL